MFVTCQARTRSRWPSFTFGLILAIDRNIPDNVIEIRNQKWDKRRFSTAKGLFGRRLGIVGTGAIGLALAVRARAFGLDIHIIEKANRSIETKVKLDALEVRYVPDLAALASLSDILSFHVPAADETHGLVDESLLRMMQPGSMIINTSRGDVVDEAALIRAMDAKRYSPLGLTSMTPSRAIPRPHSIRSWQNIQMSMAPTT